MADNRWAEAVDVVAKRVIRSASLSCGTFDTFELDADTKRAVAHRVEELCDLMAPDEGTFEAAHDYLREYADAGH